MKTEQQLEQAIRQLPQDILPERDLWPELADKLPERRRFSEWQRWSAVAVFCFVSVMGYQLFSWFQPAAGQQSTELVLLQLYEQRKAEQLAMMGKVDQVFGDWPQQLQIWDQAISQVRYALSFYPDEPQLLTQLQVLYQQQLHYLQKVISSTETS